jgi:dihydroxyacetone kinase-like predicted kinase
VLALVEGEVLLIGSDLSTVCATLLDRMLDGGGEMVTLVLGAGAPADLGEGLTRYLADHRPFVEVQTFDGGQPHYPLLVGVE